MYQHRLCFLLKSGALRNYIVRYHVEKLVSCEHPATLVQHKDTLQNYWRSFEPAFGVHPICNPLKDFVDYVEKVMKGVGGLDLEERKMYGRLDSCRMQQ